MKNFMGRCVDKESIDEYVMHEVYADGDDEVTYVLNVVAKDPLHALEVAKFVKHEEGWRVKE